MGFGNPTKLVCICIFCSDFKLLFFFLHCWYFSLYSHIHWFYLYCSYKHSNWWCCKSGHT